MGATGAARRPAPPPARLKPSSGAGGRPAPEGAPASRRALGAGGAAGGRPGLGAAAASLAAACSEPAAWPVTSPGLGQTGAGPETFQSPSFLQILHLPTTEHLKVQPSGQKRAGLAGEEVSASALGDLALPRLGRAGRVVVIATVCENYPSLLSKLQHFKRISGEIGREQHRAAPKP